MKKESPIILERSISRQWSSLGLEERRPFYEEAERIREALQQSHLPQQLQVRELSIKQKIITLFRISTIESTAVD